MSGQAGGPGARDTGMGALRARVLLTAAEHDGWTCWTCDGPSLARDVLALLLGPLVGPPLACGCGPGAVRCPHERSCPTTRAGRW